MADLLQIWTDIGLTFDPHVSTFIEVVGSQLWIQFYYGFGCFLDFLCTKTLVTLQRPIETSGRSQFNAVTTKRPPNDLDLISIRCCNGQKNSQRLGVNFVTKDCVTTLPTLPQLP